MDEYVSKEAFIKRFEGMNMSWVLTMLDIFKEFPAADVEPVRHGRWVEYDCFCCNSDGKPVVKTGVVFVCSVCGREENCKERYCHCGARMDLEVSDD